MRANEETEEGATNGRSSNNVWKDDETVLMLTQMKELNILM